MAIPIDLIFDKADAGNIKKDISIMRIVFVLWFICLFIAFSGSGFLDSFHIPVRGSVPIRFSIFMGMAAIEFIFYLFMIFFVLSGKLTKILFAVVSPIPLLISIFMSIYSVTSVINYSFNKNPSVIRYVELIKKNIETVNSSSRKKKISYKNYSFMVKDWNSDKEISIKVNGDIYNRFNEKDVLRLEIKMGKLGVEYFNGLNDSITSVPRKKFLPDAKFPFTEEEAEKYLAKKIDK